MTALRDAGSDAYRRKALKLYNRSNNEAMPELSIEFQSLAMAYKRLAEKEDRKALLEAKEEFDET
jgi:hypothetical protein